MRDAGHPRLPPGNRSVPHLEWRWTMKSIDDIRHMLIPIIVDGKRYDCMVSAARALNCRAGTLAASFWAGRQVTIGHRIKHPDPEIERQRLALFKGSERRSRKQRAFGCKSNARKSKYIELLCDGEEFPSRSHMARAKGISVERVRKAFVWGETELDGMSIRLVDDAMERERLANGKARMLRERRMKAQSQRKAQRRKREAQLLLL